MRRRQVAPRSDRSPPEWAFSASPSLSVGTTGAPGLRLIRPADATDQLMAAAGAHSNICTQIRTAELNRTCSGLPVAVPVCMGGPRVAPCCTSAPCASLNLLVPCGEPAITLLLGRRDVAGLTTH